MSHTSAMRARGPTLAPTALLLLGLARCSSTEPGAEPPRDASSAMNAPLGPQVPGDWVQTPLRCGVRFRVPPDVIEIASQGIDSCVFRFEARDCAFHGEYGSFASRLEGGDGALDYDRQNVYVGGHPAALIAYQQEEGDAPYVAGVHFPGADTGAFSPTATVFAQCTTREARSDALLALQTVTLSDPEDDEPRADAGASASIPIYLDGSNALFVNPGERFTVAVEFIGPDQQAQAPQVDAPIVRFLGFDDTTPRRQSPGGPVHLFRFEALQPGSASVTFPGAPSAVDAGAAGREITVYVR